jgi:hypothetical protein
VFVFGLEFVDRLPAMIGPGTIEVDARRIVLEDPLGALDTVDPTVRPRAADVVLEEDDATLGGADE